MLQLLFGKCDNLRVAARAQPPCYFPLSPLTVRPSKASKGGEVKSKQSSDPRAVVVLRMKGLMLSLGSVSGLDNVWTSSTDTNTHIHTHKHAHTHLHRHTHTHTLLFLRSHEALVHSSKLDLSDLSSHKPCDRKHIHTHRHTPSTQSSHVTCKPPLVSWITSNFETLQSRNVFKLQLWRPG